MTNKALIMVGNVGSGKSTWIKKFLAEHKDEKWAVVSKDAIRFMLGGGKYVWDPEYFETFVDYFARDMIELLASDGIDVLIDETNMDVQSRSDIIDLFWSDVELTAVVMPKLTKNESILRKSKPETSYGYSIKQWEEVWERKNSKYIVPEKCEGFTNIVLVNKDWRTK